jgi:hypothetical protein
MSEYVTGGQQYEEDAETVHMLSSNPNQVKKNV